MLGAFCELYNAGLQQRIEAYQRQRKSFGNLDQANELKAVRLADEAFAALFRRLKTKAKAGFPRFRGKSWFDSAEFRVGDGLRVRQSKRLAIVGIPADIKVAG